MASELDANLARQRHGEKLMRLGAHALGVEKDPRATGDNWVVIAYAEPAQKVDFPSSLTVGDVRVPVLLKRNKPFALE